MDSQSRPDPGPPAEEMSRRDLFGWLQLGASLAASYGVAGFFALRYLYPPRRDLPPREVFVATTDRLSPGATMPFTLPDGRVVQVTNAGGSVSALSTICPHLGCQVRWRPVEGDFLCPCHDGIFAADGAPVSGPPKAEATPLQRFDVVVRGRAIYLQIPVVS